MPCRAMPGALIVPHNSSGTSWQQKPLLQHQADAPLLAAASASATAAAAVAVAAASAAAAASASAAAVSYAKGGGVELPDERDVNCEAGQQAEQVALAAAAGRLLGMQTGAERTLSSLSPCLSLSFSLSLSLCLSVSLSLSVSPPKHLH